VVVSELHSRTELWSTGIQWQDSDWREDGFPLRLAAGTYLVSFEADAPWSNPQQRDRNLWGENRSLGIALSSLSFSGVR